MRTLLALAAIALASGCKSDIDLTLFTSDVISVGETGQSLDTVAVIGVNAGSESTCEKHADAIKTSLESGFSSVEFLGCRTDNFETYGDFRVSLPIALMDSATDSALTVFVARSDVETTAALIPDKARIEKIVESLPSDMTYFISGKPEPRIEILLQNDLPDTATVGAQGVFVDGQPFQLSEEFGLQRRAQMVITISDVGNAGLNSSGTLLFWIKNPTAP